MNVIQPLKTLIVKPISKHTATVIFVHGLGDSGHGWQPVAEILQRDPALSHIKWVLPHANQQPVTANGGMKMPSWFDIYSFDFDSDEDEAGMLKTSASINALISEEVNGDIDANRVILGGFSQGGAMSLLSGLTSERKLGGVAVLSGWLPLKNKFKAMAVSHAAQTPLFWGHGTSDPLVKFKLGTDSVEFLKSQLGFKQSDNSAAGLDFHSYAGMAHSSCQEELNDLSAWLKRVAPALA
ncbi:Phospholipase/carboxylesterase [Athelia psychrophila]|uniref:Acyl-protein thioesterase 1 n=1 Tax=Athelia psychrophila TaxID=1759441 RepID=A0A167UHB6_9AGAM|nr:Phospholipase/carboxylesterase [Fibularhizoctonia sp. CBS 109695]